MTGAESRGTSTAHPRQRLGIVITPELLVTVVAAVIFVTTAFGFVPSSGALALCGVVALGISLLVVRGKSRSRTLNVDWAVTLWAVGSWISYKINRAEPAALPHLTIVLVAVLQYHIFRNLRRPVPVFFLAVAATAAVAVSSAGLRAFFRRYSVWSQLGFEHPELFPHQLTFYFGNPRIGNATGLLLVLFSLCIAATALSGELGRTRGVRIMAWIGAASTGLTLYLSFSRAVYIGLVAWFCYLLACFFCLRVWPPRRAWWKALETLLALTAVLLFLGLLRPGVESIGLAGRSVSDDRSNAGRIEVYRFGREVWGENLLFGAGGGDFAGLASRELARFDRPAAAQALNTYLQVAVEYGLLGLIPLVALICMGITFPFRRSCLRESRGRAIAICCLAAGLVFGAVYNLFWSSLLSNVSSAASYMTMLALVGNLVEEAEECAPA